jgi:hypothetical protein
MASAELHTHKHTYLLKPLIFASPPAFFSLLLALFLGGRETRKTPQISHFFRQCTGLALSARASPYRYVAHRFFFPNFLTCFFMNFFSFSRCPTLRPEPRETRRLLSHHLSLSLPVAVFPLFFLGCVFLCVLFCSPPYGRAQPPPLPQLQPRRPRLPPAQARLGRVSPHFI